MASTISLRPATPDDADAIAAIYLSSRKTFVSFAPLVHTDDEIHRWIRETLIPEHQVTVAEENGAIVAMMALSRKEGIVWIDQLYLAPNVVGKGIGTALVNFAKSTLGPPIRLHTFQENTDARKFYEKLGFRARRFSDGSGNEEKCPDLEYEWTG
jgi:GNAT superfamily N-acetyltransferase